MKKKVAVLLIFLLSFFVPAEMCFAADSHGADARSSSMSVESGEDPVPDESVTKEAGGGEIIEGSANLEEAFDDEQGEELVDGDGMTKTTDVVSDKSNDESFVNSWGITGNVKQYALIGAAALIVIIIIALVTRSAKKKKKAYKTKH